MGLRDLFKKKNKDKDKKEDTQIDFALKFIECFEEFGTELNISEIEKIINEWVLYSNDDANFHYARIILSLLNNENHDYEDLFIKANEFQPKNVAYFYWFKNKAEELIQINKSSSMDVNRNGKNFKYLDDLICNGLNEIVLDSDIILDNGEESLFMQGISLNRDGIIIDGNGHCIDAKNKTRIFMITGKNITIKNLILKNSYCRDGGAIYNKNNDVLNIIKTRFVNNSAEKNGGAILNEIGKLNIEYCMFKENNSKYGGAINNQPDTEISISDSKFFNNHSTVSGGGITNNYGKVILKNVKFKDNASKNGGAIANFGLINILDSLFEKNSSENGGAINAQEGSLNVKNTSFLNNTSHNSGGAIFNSSELMLHDCNFKENDSRFEAGAIYLAENSKSRINDCSFSQNKSLTNGAAISNYSIDARIVKSTFINNDNEYNVIFNNNSLELLSVEFKSNTSKNIILNEANSRLDIQYNKFCDNSCNDSVINNNGQFCAISNGTFKNNTSKIESCEDIINNTLLDITNPKFSNDTPTIFNKGLLNARKFKNVDIHVRNEGQIESFDIDSPFNHEFNFSFLDKIIHDGNMEINLNHDIFLDNYEMDFYEGGIDLDIDGLLIDGHGHFIDGHGKSRIFNVIGKNVTIKNLIFKNASFLTNFDSQASGGGAISIIKEGSLELVDCQFLNNTSQGKGGAILNNGNLVSNNCKYLNNSSKYNGGAIFNKECLVIENDTFTDNESKIGSAIYSKNNLTINDNCEFSNNISDFTQPIYSIGSVETNDFQDDLDDLIYNPSVSTKTSNIGSFAYLEKQIKNNEMIGLKQDIIFDYSSDKQLIDGIDIEHELIIDGNGFSIDGKDTSSFFNINNNVNVTFKNIKFINGHSNASSIISNKGDLNIENCEFKNNGSYGDNSLIDNKKSLKINDLKCFNNSSKNKSLINNECDLEVSNSTFIDNQSDSDGTIIFNKSRTTIKSSVFKSNSSKTDGGAVSNWEKSYMEIFYTEFIGNVSEVNGGSIINRGDLKLSQSRFEYCSSRSGGALYSFYGALEIESTCFVNNTSKDIAGAIANEDGSILKIAGCKFNGNNSHDNGAIANNGELILNNTEFINNSSNSHGGVMTNQNNAVITNSQFISNKSGESGGGIINLGEMILENSKFENNSSSLGGAINCSKGSMEIIHTEFLNNNASQEGGAIFNFGKINIIKSTFENNDSNLGGAIINKTFYQSDLDGFNYLKETIDVDNSGIIKINETSFIKNSVKEDGGAILNWGNINIINSRFESNKSSRNGGAINSQKGIVTIQNSYFIKNKSEIGAGIVNFDVLNILDSEFKQNKAKINGGALFNQLNTNVYIENTVFFKNFTKDFGGAILNGGNIEILESNFDSNHARREGGAIHNQESGLIKLTSTTFVNNRAVVFGAIYSANSDAYIINNCKFENNIPDIGIDI